MNPEANKMSQEQMDASAEALRKLDASMEKSDQASDLLAKLAKEFGPADAQKEEPKKEEISA
ncbi:MAG: hypothetical protein PHD72_04770 [Patescibacteria group bacterium]|nr:hypothetical protein [Patescibacteria group bacterium]